MVRIIIADDNGRSCPSNAVRWNHASAKDAQNRARREAREAREAKVFRPSDSDAVLALLAMVTTD